jgi:hypothetical protein
MAANSFLQSVSFLASLGMFFNYDLPTPVCMVAIYVQLRKALLWQKVRCDKFGWSDKGKPVWLILILLLAGDVELNPGPGILRCCHCNRNGICKNCLCAKAGISCLPRCCLNNTSATCCFQL